MTTDDKREIVDRAIEDLREHFSEVLILCSQEIEDGDTERVYRGGGNVMARIGMAHDYIEWVRDARPVKIINDYE